MGDLFPAEIYRKCGRASRRKSSPGAPEIGLQAFRIGLDVYARPGVHVANTFLGTNSGSTGVYGGGDYGIVHYEAAGLTVFGVINGSSQAITAAADPLPGQGALRRGVSSGSASGYVLGVNATVTYGDGTTLTGMIKTTVCGIPGDSGGPLYFQDTGFGIFSGGTLSCLSPAVTYYQPLTPLLSGFFLHLWD